MTYLDIFAGEKSTSDRSVRKSAIKIKIVRYGRSRVSGKKEYILVTHTHGWKCEKWYGEYTETRGHYLSHPRLRNGVTVTYRRYRDL